jgi:hypothetical protein
VVAHVNHDVGRVGDGAEIQRAIASGAAGIVGSMAIRLRIVADICWRILGFIGYPFIDLEFVIRRPEPVSKIPF